MNEVIHSAPASSPSLELYLACAGMRMSEDYLWVAIGSIAAVLGAIATGIIAFVTLRSLPAIRRELTKSHFVLGELEELIRLGAKGPEDETQGESDVTDPVILTDVRTGRHDPVFDRIVFEFVFSLPSYRIVPLDERGLGERDVQGIWGLSVNMSPCRVRYCDGPDQGSLAPRDTAAYPRLPSITHHRLVKEEETLCEWVIGLHYRSRYLVFELGDPPRLIVDFFRQSSD